LWVVPRNRSSSRGGGVYCFLVNDYVYVLYLIVLYILVVWTIAVHIIRLREIKSMVSMI
jgi:hypothetical protein